MILSSKARTLVVATAALTVAGVIAAAPASAHTNNLYSYMRTTPDAEPAFQGFTALSKSTGVATPLAQQPLAPEFSVMGIEVAAEKGTVIGYEEDGPFVAEWNHSTGIAGAHVAAYLSGSDDGFEYIGLDTLNNGTTVTIVFYAEPVGESFEDRIAIASVNAGTGELIPLVGIIDALEVEGEVDYDVNSLATDPATGITYIFLQNSADESFYLAVDVAAGTVGEPTLFQGDGFGGPDEGDFDGEILGADFDPGDGSLYFIYISYLDDEFQLSRLGSPADWVTATRQVISTAPAQNDTYALAPYALTAETPALAATGSELPVAALVLGGTLAVVAGGVTIAVARRRREAGTV